MSYNGSGTFNINTAGQPVVTGTVISSSVFNALTADLATGLSTAITKDGQTTITANIPMNSYKFTGLAAGTAATDSVRLGQLQAGSATVITVTGTDTYTGTMSPALAAYAAGNMFTFVVPNTNTTACTINIDGLGAKSITRDGSTALVAGDLVANSEVTVIYDGTRFQVLNSNSKTNWTVSNALTLSAGTANGVAYLNGSKALTTGSALVFDGTNLGIGTSSPAYKLQVNGRISYSGAIGEGADTTLSSAGTTLILGESATWTALSFRTGGTERARIDSSGNFGIGTSSPSYKLVVNGANARVLVSTGDTSYSIFNNTNSSGQLALGIDNSTGSGYGMGNYSRVIYSDGAYPLCFATNGSEKMRLDSSGNLGLGVTPSAWGSNVKAIEGAYGSALSWSTGGAELNIESNAYYNGTNWIYKTSAFATLYSSAGYNGKHSWYTAPSGTAGNAISWTQAMTLDASGRLLVGVTTASTGARATLGSAAQASGSACGDSGILLSSTANLATGEYAPFITWSGNATNPNRARAAIGAVSTGTTSALDLVFLTRSAADASEIGTGSERARIDSSGNLLVGTTSTGGRLTVRQDSTTASPLYIVNAAVSGTFASFEGNGAVQGSITWSGSTTAYNTTSDQRLKENITDADSASDLIDAIKVRQFDWKADGTHQRYGMIAQELYEVAPEAVHAPADPDDMMAVDYSKLVPMLIKEVQSLRQRVAQLEVK